MARIVMKFGGTSMAGTDRIRNVASLVRHEIEAGNEVAVVVSAMAGDTDRLVTFCREAHPDYDAAEYDVVVATGEQVTAGLLALCLQSLGTPARSWLGWQLPINTTGHHGRARVGEIGTDAMVASMQAGHVAVVPGFQGLMDGAKGSGRISTLGRGGSDTSAVAVAAAIGAERCDIYTDVDGVYTTDPRIVARARKLDYITYEEMLELASVGAKVLQTRSVGLAMKMGVRVQVLSSFVEPGQAPKPGTMIVGEDEIEDLFKGSAMERQLITGIAHDKNEALVMLIDIPERPGNVADLFGPLAESGINVDMIVQTPSRGDGLIDLMFTVPQADLAKAIELFETRRDAIGYARMTHKTSIAKISVVGVGMKSHAGVASTMFKALADRGIEIQAISTSEIKISVVIEEDYSELAVRILHTAYGLDAEVGA